MDLTPLTHAVSQLIVDLSPIVVSVLTPYLVYQLNAALQRNAATKDLQINAEQQRMLESLALQYVAAAQEAQRRSRNDPRVPTLEGTQLKDAVMGKLGMEFPAMTPSRIEAAIDAAVHHIHPEREVRNG